MEDDINKKITIDIEMKSLVNNKYLTALKAKLCQMA